MVQDPEKGTATRLLSGFCSIMARTNMRILETMLMIWKLMLCGIPKGLLGCIEGVVTMAHVFGTLWGIVGNTERRTNLGFWNLLCSGP